MECYGVCSNTRISCCAKRIGASKVRFESVDMERQGYSPHGCHGTTRRRAAREVERAKQLQQQLRTVESSLKSRGALELATTELETEREALQHRIEVLRRENAALKLQSDRERAEPTKLKLNSQPWETHYEAQHEEIKRLKEQVQDAGRIPEELAEQHAKQTRDLAELREAHEQLQQRVADTEHMVIVQQQRREDMATRLRLVAGEVRQYLRLVRGEIKRKFGYLPEAIAHAESWARIAEALELLLCQSSDRCVARGRGNGK
ncbi:hypothetical protein GQ600_20162 [Phytophthora cactorum]|nr:hypothetical protein GQ600_20162 [Phytophthora cactorum]